MFNKTLFYTSRTDIGKRSNNEDQVFAELLNKDLYVFAVADGMGGADAGEVASQLAIEAAVEAIRQVKEKILTKEISLKVCLENAFSAAHERIALDKAKHPSRAEMATTMVLLIVYRKRYVIGNIGDSRLYLHRRKKLKLLTKDHNYIFEEQEKSGKVLPKEVIKNYGHLVTNMLDGNYSSPDIFPIRKKAFRMCRSHGLLLCSDGLITDDVFNDSTEIALVINENKSFDSTSDVLIKWALENGAKDNISVIYVTPRLP